MNSVDLLIQDDDLVISGVGEPLLVSSFNCVAQDIRHMIREKGYVVRMVGERSPLSILSLTKEIELEIEDDSRIYPGTARVELSGETLICTAKTIDGNAIAVSV